MMKRFAFALVLASILLTTAAVGSDEDEISLFDSTGKATAYIAEELTIYLWSGKPVAYLDKDDADGFHIYGFNGKHLGWFVSGVVRDHKGNAVGAVKEVFATPPGFEPFTKVQLAIDALYFEEHIISERNKKSRVLENQGLMHFVS